MAAGRYQKERMTYMDNDYEQCTGVSATGLRCGRSVGHKGWHVGETPDGMVGWSFTPPPAPPKTKARWSEDKKRIAHAIRQNAGAIADMIIDADRGKP